MKRGSFFNPMPTAALQRLSIVSARPKGRKEASFTFESGRPMFFPLFRENSKWADHVAG